MTQLRGEAGPRQIATTPAYAHNAGGLRAIDEALCGVAVLAAGAARRG